MVRFAFILYTLQRTDLQAKHQGVYVIKLPNSELKVRSNRQRLYKPFSSDKKHCFPPNISPSLCNNAVIDVRLHSSSHSKLPSRQNGNNMKTCSGEWNFPRLFKHCLAFKKFTQICKCSQPQAKQLSLVSISLCKPVGVGAAEMWGGRWHHWTCEHKPRSLFYRKTFSFIISRVV